MFDCTVCMMVLEIYVKDCYECRYSYARSYKKRVTKIEEEVNDCLPRPYTRLCMQLKWLSPLLCAVLRAHLAVSIHGYPERGGYMMNVPGTLC
jgi:hypothetical protein